MSLGQRTVADLMAECSMHLIEPITVQTLASPVAAAPPATIVLSPSTSSTLPASPIPATAYLYPGVQIVVGWQTDPSDAEVATVLTVAGDGVTFTANLVNNHAAGETIFGATFPTQQPTDPIFTQPEIIGYIAQAQNEFLTKVPLIFELFDQEVLVGQPYQTLPGATIELERVAVQSNPPSTSFDIAAISRTGGEVTAILVESVNPDQWTPQLAIQVFGVVDSSYNSAANATFLLDSVSVDGLTLTWPQVGADSVSTGGQVSRPVLTRLYESAQEQIMLNQPWGLTGPNLQSWYEDRTGTYGFGVAPVPQGNQWVELLTSIRAPETLGLLDNLIIPDIFAYAVIWRSLAYCWSKDGVQRSPTMEKFAKGKFDFYCLLADRFLRHAMNKLKEAA